MKLSDRIIKAVEDLAIERDGLAKLEAKLGDAIKAVEDIDDGEAPTEEMLASMQDLTKQVEDLRPSIEKKKQALDALRATEKALGDRGARDNQVPAITGQHIAGTRAAKQNKPGDIIVRLGVAKVMAHLRRQPEEQVLEELYGDNEAVKAAFAMVHKTAVAPALTTATGWAAELVSDDMRGLLEDVESQSVAAALALAAERNGGMRIDFGANKTVTVPKMDPTGATPTEPAWVGEGGAIPLMAFSFSSITLNRYKLAGIVASTMELMEQSPYQVEQIFRRGMQRAYVRVLDNAFLSASAAVSGVRPAGLLNGITVAAGDATGGMESVRVDISDMLGEILTANENAVPVLAVNNQDRLNLSLIVSPLGQFVFRDEVTSGRLLNIPIVSSGNVPAGTAYMVDVSSLATAFDIPEYRVSQEATVVYANADGTAPTHASDAAGAIGTAGQVIPSGGQIVAGSGQPPGAAGVGYSAMSAYQQWLELVRAIWPTSFALMRAGTVAGRDTLAWA